MIFRFCCATIHSIAAGSPGAIPWGNSCLSINREGIQDEIVATLLFERMLRMLSLSALIVLSLPLIESSIDMDSDGMNAGQVTAGMGVNHAMSDRVNQHWLESIEHAERVALSRKLPLLLHFEADWCGACRTMDSTVLRNAKVVKHLGTSVVAVRINADRDPDLLTQYGISSLPTEVVIGIDGHELARYVGGATLGDYVTRLENLGKHASVAYPGSDSSDDSLRPCLLVRRQGHLVGLGGYSPVAMQQEKKWMTGSEEFVGTYLGVDYFFQSAEERELFFAGPEQYIPSLHGCDPVELQLTRRAAAGAIELGAFYKGRLFFFLSEKNRQRFHNNPAWYTDRISLDNIEDVEKYPFLRSMTLN